MREYWNTLREQLKPKYHELTAYLMAVTCTLLFIFQPEFRKMYFKFLSATEFPTLWGLTILATLGLLLSFIQVFLRRKKSWFEKMCMGVFILGVNGFAGIAAGLEMLPSRESIVAVIPLFNIPMGIILLYQIGLQKFDVTDDDATIREVIFTSIILLIVFAVASFGFHLTWAMTFSVCIFCSSVLFLFIWMINYFHFQSSSRA